MEGAHRPPQLVLRCSLSLCFSSPLSLTGGKGDEVDQLLSLLSPLENSLFSLRPSRCREIQTRVTKVNIVSTQWWDDGLVPRLGIFSPSPSSTLRDPRTLGIRLQRGRMDRKDKSRYFLRLVFPVGELVKNS